MKNLKAIMLLFLGLVLVSCSSDDDSGSTSPVNGDYFPSTIGDLWIYNVENRNADDPAFDFDATDLLTVNTGTATDYTVEVNSGTTPAAGSMNSFLADGALSKTDDMLLFNGELELPEAFSGFSNETILLTDAALYDLNAEIGELSNTPGTINQDFDLGGTLIPLVINYAFTTSKLTNATNTLTVDGTNYSNVMKGNLSLEVTVTATVDLLGTGTPTTVSVLSSQNVLSIDYYFAKDIGLIKADAVQGYAVDDTFIALLELIPGFELTIPTSLSVTNVQDIDSFVVN